MTEAAMIGKQVDERGWRLLRPLTPRRTWLRGLDLNQRPLGYEGKSGRDNNQVALTGTSERPSLRRRLHWSVRFISVRPLHRNFIAYCGAARIHRCSGTCRRPQVHEAGADFHVIDPRPTRLAVVRIVEGCHQVDETPSITGRTSPCRRPRPPPPRMLPRIARARTCASARDPEAASERAADARPGAMSRP